MSESAEVDDALQTAYGLQMDGELDAAVRAYADIAARYSGSTTEGVPEQVQRALYQQAHLERELGRGSDADATEATAAHGDDGTPRAHLDADAVRDHIAEAINRAGEGDDQGALELLADVIAPWRDGPPPPVLAPYLDALMLMASVADRAGPNDAAVLETYDLVLRHRDELTEPDQRIVIALAMTKKADVLERGGRDAEAGALRAAAVAYTDRAVP